MSYKDINISKSYKTSKNKDDLLNNFYIPFLEQSKMYFRVAGFFSSSSLAVASKGIEGLIKNNGKMRLLISPELSSQDYEIIRNNGRISDTMSLFQNFNVEEFPKNDNLKALAWLLSNNLLEIKIVVDKNTRTSIFHQKFGIGYDSDGNMLSFSGSINESAQAWLDNIEEFKTFKSWEIGQLDYLTDDLKEFNSYWNNEKNELADVFDLPESIKQKIISVKPDNIYDLAIMKKYEKEKTVKGNELSLFCHQEKAVEMWIENNNRLLMEMATGTGKTRTAIGCIVKMLKSEKNLLVIVSTPQNTLSKQWLSEMKNLNIIFEKSSIIDGNNSNWNIDLEKTLLELNLGYVDNAIIYTTHATSSGDKYLNIIRKNKQKTKILFICDEVHGIGSEKQRNALLNEYEYRIGLSATPERLFDEEGTRLIRDYFGNKSFEFTISDALNTINPLTGKAFLNPFYYYPHFIELEENELGEYKKYSRRILIMESDEDHDEKDLTRIKNLRAEIVKNAINKYDMVESIIDNININEKIKDTLIFVSPEQKGKIMDMLASKKITRCKITEEESTKKKLGNSELSEREAYIDQFRKGEIQVLLGLSCLDEGIDIKNARIAILMASSVNPREYVQRIGRVIRVNEGKEYSVIHDIIVRTCDDNNKVDNVLLKESRRVYQIAKNAINYDRVKEIFKGIGVDLDGYK